MHCNIWNIFKQSFNDRQWIGGLEKKWWKLKIVGCFKGGTLYNLKHKTKYVHLHLIQNVRCKKEMKLVIWCFTHKWWLNVQGFEQTHNHNNDCRCVPMCMINIKGPIFKSWLLILQCYTKWQSWFTNDDCVNQGFMLQKVNNIFVHVHLWI